MASKSKLSGRATPGKLPTTLRERAAKYKSEGVILDRNDLFCSYCMCPLANNKFRIEQHISSRKHEDSKHLKQRQQTVFGMKKDTEFGQDLCRVIFVIPTVLLATFKNYVNRSNSHSIIPF